MPDLLDLLVLLALWCFAAFCFGFGWIMGHASAMGKQADDLLDRWRLNGPPGGDLKRFQKARRW